MRRRHRIPISIVALVAWIVTAAAAAPAQPVQLLSPSIQFTAKEVFFLEPVRYQAPDGTARKATSALKLLLVGRGFYDADTGPFYYLGHQKADFHYTSPDGRKVAVYFFDVRKIGRREPLRILLRTDEWLTLEKPFVADEVKWLPAEIRARRELPDLREQLETEE